MLLEHFLPLLEKFKREPCSKEQYKEPAQQIAWRTMGSPPSQNKK
jgi:hypothetical protein